jgi:putative ABC transport system ATP-binding protein
MNDRAAPPAELIGASHMWAPDAGLHPIDLIVEAGELVVIRGRSGSGKSTLLALLAGLCQPDAGVVRVLGETPRLDMPWSQLAIVPQVLALATELSIAENIVDCAPGSAPEAIADVMRRLDLEELAERTTSAVSMGQQQRAAVARAMIANPRVLLADEPTSFQDDDHTAGVAAALRHAAHHGAGVVAATHDPVMVAAADRVVDLTAH